VESFWTLLWDLRLDVGHSVRTVAQCVEEAARDITVATNLMEARLLAGEAALYRSMRAATGPDRIWPSDAFFAAKRAEQAARHRRFHDTAYNLEPNIKEGPGGLRDIQRASTASSGKGASCCGASASGSTCSPAAARTGCSSTTSPSWRAASATTTTTPASPSSSS